MYTREDMVEAFKEGYSTAFGGRLTEEQMTEVIDDFLSVIDLEKIIPQPNRKLRNAASRYKSMFSEEKQNTPKWDL
jgi:hypothetical protein